MRVNVTLLSLGLARKVNMRAGEVQIEESDDEKSLGNTLDKE